MNLRRIGVLAPCDGLEDFPTHFVGEEAACLLASWTAAWQPQLLNAVRRLPEIVSLLEPPAPADWSEGLLIVPHCFRKPSADWLAEVRSQDRAGCVVIEGVADRAAIVDTTHAALPELQGVRLADAEDSFALGLAFLQTIALTGSLQATLREAADRFEEDVLLSAGAALTGDSTQLEQSLRRCYDHLEDARQNTYPLELFLLDVTLVDDAGLGSPLRDAIAESSATNVLLTGSAAETICETAPESQAALRLAVSNGRMSVLAGGYSGADLATLSPESLLREIRNCSRAVERLIGEPARLFAQHCSSLPPRLPQLLESMDYQGALLCGFDGKALPPLDQGRTTWVGLDGATLEAALAPPRDLALPETMLGLHEHLAATLSQDHVPTVLFAGWAGHRSPFYQDLITISKRSDLLGKFVTMQDYLATSSTADHWSTVGSDGLGPRTAHCPSAPARSSAIEARDHLLQGLADVALAQTDSHDSSQRQDEAIPDLLRAIGAEPDANADTEWTSLNPWTSARASTAAKVTPALGFAVTRADEVAGSPPRAEHHALQNEHMIVTVHAETGGVKSLRHHATRSNQLSQRLFIVSHRGVALPVSMTAQEVTVDHSNTLCGQIRSAGVLESRDGTVFAEFNQVVSLQANTPALIMRMDVEPRSAMRTGDQIVCRLKSGSGSERVCRGLQWTRLPVHHSSFLAGDGFQIYQDSAAALSVAVERPIVCSRRSQGVVDLVLAKHEDAPAELRIAVSANAAYPTADGLAALAPPVVVSTTGKPGPRTGWWLHLDAANVILSHTEATRSPKGVATGVRARIVETEGRATAVRLRCYQPFRSARLCSFRGVPKEEIVVEEGAAAIEIGAYGWLQVEASW